MIHQVINEMEKVGDSQPSSSEPVSPTSKEMMKEPPRRLEIVTSEMLENEWGDAINDFIKSIPITELDAIKSIIDDDNKEEEEIKLLNNDDAIAYVSGRIPEIQMPEVAARRTEVLYHGEKETESENYHNGRDRTVMAMDCIQSKTSRVPEVADTKIKMEHSKNSRWWR
ncbi:uncharacterized protein LOC121970488 [Zingiber officinale]|uniref:uncharacterized protein LOC121970488 n=1 Tax=Zingiber officinale TaxID=94328 RepID=UPI001C4C8292|nr:uncharacterized protein LOC121970488 [Zingiber officinale]